jgi:hypothetical protein
MRLIAPIPNSFSFKMLLSLVVDCTVYYFAGNCSKRKRKGDRGAQTM